MLKTSERNCEETDVSLPRAWYATLLAFYGAQLSSHQATTPWQASSEGKNNIFEVKLMLFHPGNVGDRRLKIYERGTLTMATPDMGRGGT